MSQGPLGGRDIALQRDQVVFVETESRTTRYQVPKPPSELIGKAQCRKLLHDLRLSCRQSAQHQQRERHTEKQASETGSEVGQEPAMFPPVMAVTVDTDYSQ